MMPFYLRSPAVRGGMHQPMADLADFRNCDPLETLNQLVAIQRAVSHLPWSCAASVDQERPGVFHIADDGLFSHRIIIGLGRILDQMVAEGMIERVVVDEAEETAHA